MHRSRFRSLSIAVVLGASLVTSMASSEEPLYRPKFSDAPPARVSQANRGGATDLRLFVLAPEQKGASATASPVLTWFLSADSAMPLEIVIQPLGADRPLLERRIDPAGKAGFSSIDLAALGVALAPGREYEWSVALVVDPARRASDLFSKGSVQFVPSSAPVTEVSEQGVRKLLDQGYWYDAIAMIQRGVARNPQDPAMQALWQGLLASQQLVARQ